MTEITTSILYIEGVVDILIFNVAPREEHEWESRTLSHREGHGSVTHHLPVVPHMTPV
jgi:hypothetical protein